MPGPSASTPPPDMKARVTEARWHPQSIAPWCSRGLVLRAAADEGLQAAPVGPAGRRQWLAKPRQHHEVERGHLWS